MSKIERPSDRRRRAVTAYVVDRLRREADAYGRGFGALLAKKTGFTPAHVSTVLSDQRAPGQDFCDALAHYWTDLGSYAALELAAEKWFGSTSAAVVRSQSRIRDIGSRLGVDPRDIEAAEQTRAAWSVHGLSDAQIRILLRATQRAREDVEAIGSEASESDFRDDG